MVGVMKHYERDLYPRCSDCHKQKAKPSEWYATGDAALFSIDPCTCGGI